MSNTEIVPTVWPAEKSALVEKIVEVAQDQIIEDFRFLLARGPENNRILADIADSELSSNRDRLAAIDKMNAAKLGLLTLFDEGNPMKVALQRAVEKAAQEGLNLEGYAAWVKAGCPAPTPQPGSAPSIASDPTQR